MLPTAAGAAGEAPVALSRDAQAFVLCVRPVGAELGLAGSSAVDQLSWWHRFYTTLDAEVVGHGLCKAFGDTERLVIVSRGAGEALLSRLETILSCARGLEQAAEQLRYPDGTLLELQMGLAFGEVTDGLLSCPTFLHAWAGRPFILADALSAHGVPRHVQVAAECATLLSRQGYALVSRALVQVTSRVQETCYLVANEPSGAGPLAADTASPLSVFGAHLHRMPVHSTSAAYHMQRPPNLTPFADAHLAAASGWRPLYSGTSSFDVAGPSSWQAASGSADLRTSVRVRGALSVVPAISLQAQQSLATLGDAPESAVAAVEGAAEALDLAADGAASLRETSRGDRTLDAAQNQPGQHALASSSHATEDMCRAQHLPTKQCTEAGPSAEHWQSQRVAVGSKQDSPSCSGTALMHGVEEQVPPPSVAAAEASSARHGAAGAADSTGTAALLSVDSRQAAMLSSTPRMQPESTPQTNAAFTSQSAVAGQPKSAQGHPNSSSDTSAASARQSAAAGQIQSAHGLSQNTSQRNAASAGQPAAAGQHNSACFSWIALPGQPTGFELREAKRAGFASCSQQGVPGAGSSEPQRQPQPSCNAAPGPPDSDAVAAQESFLQNCCMQFIDGSLEQRFRVWFAEQRHAHDLVVMVISMLIAGARCKRLLSQPNLDNIARVQLRMVLVMAVHLPICATIIALKLLRPAWFKRHRGQFVALARFSRMAFVVVAHSVDAEEHVSGCSWGSRIYQVFIKESLGFCFLTNMMECGLLVAHLSGIPIVLALLSVSVPWACAPAPVLSFCTLRVASLLILVGSLVPALYLARLEYRMRKAFIRKEQARLHCKQD